MKPAEAKDWAAELAAAIVVCDTQGIIIYMNRQAEIDFEADGGAQLLGKNVLDCHPEPARTKLQDLLRNQKSNVYTVEKGGIKKLIYQLPWFKEGKYAGLVEISLVIPSHLPHYIR